ncbi:MAG: hypothetical protein JST32_21280, partial [Bacteroidetes bacterium]|nr:hypothetical protein [Bacteroidota bacterium]
ITECIPSDTIAELPVNAAAINLEIAISMSTASDTYMNDLDSIVSMQF